MKERTIKIGSLYRLRIKSSPPNEYPTLPELLRRRGDTLFRVTKVLSDGVVMQAQSTSGKRGISLSPSFDDFKGDYEPFPAEEN